MGPLLLYPPRWGGCGVVVGSNRERYQHQNEAREKAITVGSLGFFMGMRTGKTLTTIDTVNQLQAWPCLIICPLAAILTWRAELLREGVEEDDIVVVRSNKGVKIAKNFLLYRAKYFIVNFDTVPALDAMNLRSTWQPMETMAAAALNVEIFKEARAPRALDLEDWASVVVDESYKIANGESRITQYLHKRPKPYQQHRFCLSGTPAAENPYQYAAQFIFMFGEFFGCTNVLEYMQKFWVWNERKRKWKVGESCHLDAIRHLVQERAYCVTMYELGLGCTVFNTSRDVEATDLQRAAFEWLTYARTYPHKKTGEIMEMEPGVRVLFHRQIAAGVHPLTGEILSDNKILDFIQYHKDTGQRLLVSSFFVPPLKRAAELCEAHGLRAAVITGGTKPHLAEEYRLAFQAGELDIIIGQEDKISRALEFSKLGAIFVLSASYSEETREQLEERGQHVNRQEPYEVISQHTDGSLEAKITRILVEKKENARYYLDQFNLEIIGSYTGP